jgi:hypothetical protein
MFLAKHDREKLVLEKSFLVFKESLSNIFLVRLNTRVTQLQRPEQELFFRGTILYAALLIGCLNASHL